MIPMHYSVYKDYHRKQDKEKQKTVFWKQKGHKHKGEKSNNNIPKNDTEQIYFTFRPAPS
ncbi:MAG: hypothetical protein D3903_05070 [Candidatus Electrothrix sp. GM3_4]|nr:hypothetical protein [Candidatus Electrothrix sp. GM3_4]